MKKHLPYIFMYTRMKKTKGNLLKTTRILPIPYYYYLIGAILEEFDKF